MTRESLQVRHEARAARRNRRRKWWIQGVLSGAVALAALIVGSNYGNIRSSKANEQLIGWGSALLILIAGSAASNRIPKALGQAAADRSVPSAGGATRILSAGVGYLIMAFAILAVLQVAVERLVVGAGLAGVILGIAAQQSLGNVFAGLVLIAARPFDIGDRLRIRSGALGGIFDATVVEMSLTYVTLTSVDGLLKVPNSGMLAAGVCHVLPDADPLPPTGTSTPRKAVSENTAMFRHPSGEMAPSSAALAETAVIEEGLGSAPGNVNEAPGPSSGTDNESKAGGPPASGAGPGPGADRIDGV